MLPVLEAQLGLYVATWKKIACQHNDLGTYLTSVATKAVINTLKSIYIAIHNDNVLTCITC